MVAIAVVYFFCALLLTVYGVNAHILTQLFKHRYGGVVAGQRRFLEDFYGSNPKARAGSAKFDQLPTVTTQLPVYNEINVVERLIDAVVAFEYPSEKHEIQILDDSTDESHLIISKKVEELRKKGVNIHHITREDRSGFKAGALRHGLAQATGEFLAIFDADFLPPPDFLLRSVPYFHNRPKLALVQARWGHINEKESWITRLQAIGIDGHFMVEQAARSTSGLFMNFNGTAGVIRKQAIVDSGNWHADTLTEDMDLSYRMQLAGWQCQFLADLVAPAEIPSNLNDFKSQQFRWAKGSTQTALKLLPQLLRSPASFFMKFQAVMHMTHYCIHPLMLILAVLAPLMLLQKSPLLSGTVFLVFGLLLLVSCTGPSRLYLVAEKMRGRTYIQTLCYLPFMVCFGCGLAINNSKAVAEAIMGKTSEFVRTPKRGGSIRKNYFVQKSPTHFFEILLGGWCVYGVFQYFSSNHYLVGHFMLLYALGFFTIGLGSWWHGSRGGTA